MTEIDRKRILDLAVAIHSTVSREELFAVLARQIGEIVRCDRASIALAPAGTSTLEVTDLLFTVEVL